MIIAILSDSHDHVVHLNLVLPQIQETDALIFCGDLCSPFMLDILAKEYEGSIHLVAGNNDGDFFRIMPKTNSRVIMHGEFAELIEIDGQVMGKAQYELLYELDFDDRTHGQSRIAVTHYPEIARALAESDKYDLICYGHNHKLSIDKVGNTFLLNPGSLMGYQPGKSSFVIPTFIKFDTCTGKAQSFEIKNSELKEPTSVSAEKAS